MELTVIRKYFKPTYTIGWLLANGTRICDVLEDKDRGLTQDMPTTEIYKKKVYGSTCIPKGRYHINMDTYSQKFGNRNWAKPYGGKVPTIENVPCWNRVLIHVGNDCSQTEGCLLTGWNKQKGKVLDSVKAFSLLMDNYLIPAKGREEEIWLTIK